MFTPSIPASLTKPYDIALTLVTQATEFAKAAHDSGVPEAASFFKSGMLFCVYTTKTGQIRYQLGISGKSERKSVTMLRVLADFIAAEREAEAKRAITVPLKAEVSHTDGQAPEVSLKGTRLLHRKGTYRYFHVGAVARGQSGRKVNGGPLVPGPWAFSFEKATVLSDSAAFRERDAAEREDAIVVDNGSRIWVDGVQYTVSFGCYGSLTLEAVDTSN